MESPVESLREYDALVARIDEFGQAVAERRSDDMQCGPGCTACCHVTLTVSPVEAAAIRRLLSRSATEVPDPRDEHDERCAMLDDHGRCSIYEARPLVCRTQGLPLRYPQGTIPEEALLGRARSGSDEVTWCPLNFESSPPAPSDVLDAERTDQLLALVNRRYAEATGEDPLTRIALPSIAFPS